VKVTLWVDDLRVEEVVRTIVEVARTGRMGDGKIFVFPAALTGQWTDNA
jgi:nitrogen regulatory protein PII